MFSFRYSGVTLYLSKAAFHSSLVDGSLVPASFHSVMDRPLRVNRVYLKVWQSGNEPDELESDITGRVQNWAH